uniref:Uncharacterized protein n=1 Tax=Anthurium amnicola TaxID=1678845 RepID=A0A1D1YK95_9ARAE
MALVKKLPEKLSEFRLHALLLGALAALALALLRLGSSLLSFFRPLLLSTALFLAAVLLLRLISQPHAGPPTDRPGEDLMDYVAGHTAAADFPEESPSGAATEAAGGGEQAAAARTSR